MSNYRPNPALALLGIVVLATCLAGLLGISAYNRVQTPPVGYAQGDSVLHRTGQVLTISSACYSVEELHIVSPEEYSGKWWSTDAGDYTLRIVNGQNQSWVSIGEIYNISMADSSVLCH